MHEDGLADTADGLWGGWDRARRLEIMKDSHIGSYGVIALLLSFQGVGPRFGCLFEASPPRPSPRLLARPDAIARRDARAHGGPAPCPRSRACRTARAAPRSPPPPWALRNGSNPGAVAVGMGHIRGPVLGGNPCHLHGPDRTVPKIGGKPETSLARHSKSLKSRFFFSPLRLEKTT